RVDYALRMTAYGAELPPIVRAAFDGSCPKSDLTNIFGTVWVGRKAELTARTNQTFRVASINLPFGGALVYPRSSPSFMCLAPPLRRSHSGRAIRRFDQTLQPLSELHAPGDGPVAGGGGIESEAGLGSVARANRQCAGRDHYHRRGRARGGSRTRRLQGP